jgi:hypothetical protein
LPNLLSAGVALSLHQLNVRLNELTAAAMAIQPQAPRGYLGASICGYECLRRVQYQWWCATEIPSQTRLVFERGHLLEAVVRTQLEMIGFAFAPGESLEFKAFDGIFAGHPDGVAIAGPRLPGVYLPYPLVWENKAVSAKNWRAVNERGLRAIFPHYAAQVSIYQCFLNKTNNALVTMVNSDNGEVLHFQQPYDAALADRTIENVKTVIEATKKGELLPRAYSDPNDWRCGVCPHARRCWGPLWVTGKDSSWGSEVSGGDDDVDDDA